MKVIVYNEYGPAHVLKQSQKEVPLIGNSDILIRVHASSVSAADWRMRKADPFLARLFNGILKPRKVNILGFELSGVVVQLGKAVTRFKIGDEVMATTGFKFGTYAEYVAINENSMVVKKPEGIQLSDAAGVPVGANTAVHFLLNKGKLTRNQKVLIYGASGSVGTYAVQIAKSIGAEVTGICSKHNSELVTSIGADRVLNYDDPNFKLPDNYFDLVFDAVGKTSKYKVSQSMKSKAKFLSVRKGTATMNRENLEMIQTLLENKSLKPVIDKIFPIREVISAHKYVEQQHKKGNVILLVDGHF